MALHYAAWHETLLPYGIDLPPSFIDNHAGVPTHGIVAEVNKLWGTQLDGDADHGGEGSSVRVAGFTRR